MTWVAGIDASFSRIDRNAFRALYEDGYRVFVQALWTGGYAGNDRLKVVAEPNLADAQDEGFAVHGYINASPWYPATQGLWEAERNAGHMWAELLTLPLDVEIDGLTEAHIRDYWGAIRAIKPSCIYSAHWYWSGRLGNPKWPWLWGTRIWSAYYDLNPDVDFGSLPWGPWSVDGVVGEQYRGSYEILPGIEVDLNSFDSDFWLAQGGEPVELPDGLYRISGGPEVYLKLGSLWIHIPTQEALAALATDIRVVNRSQLTGVIVYPDPLEAP